MVALEIDRRFGGKMSGWDGGRCLTDLRSLPNFSLLMNKKGGVWCGFGGGCGGKEPLF